MQNFSLCLLLHLQGIHYLSNPEKIYPELLPRSPLTLTVSQSCYSILIGAGGELFLSLAYGKTISSSFVCFVCFVSLVVGFFRRKKGKR